MLAQNLFFKQPVMTDRTALRDMRAMFPTTGIRRPPATDMGYRPPMIGMPPQERGKVFNPIDAMRQQLMDSEYARIKPYMPTIEHNNQAVRPCVGHPKFGFQTMLNERTFGQLPTAPAVVGGNVDWTSSKVTPATQYLHSVLSGGRPMNPAPALGSALRLTEPTMNSIHTRY